MAGGRGRYRAMAEINVTPLVDVMVELFIVFMVAASLMTWGVTVDLPKANAAPLAQDSEPLTVPVSAEGKIFLQETGLTLTDPARRFWAIDERNHGDHKPK